MALRRRDRFSAEAPWVMTAALFGLYLVGQGHLNKGVPTLVESAKTTIGMMTAPAQSVPAQSAPTQTVQPEAVVVANPASPSQLPKEMLAMVEAINRNKKFRNLNGVEMTAFPDHVEVLMPSSPLFTGGSADTTSKAKSEVQLIGKLLKGADVKFSIIVEGHTDSSPVVKNKDRYPTNLALSKARAEKVARLLADSGLPRGRLKSVGFGSSQPAFSRDPSNVTNGEHDKRIVLRLEPSRH